MPAPKLRPFLHTAGAALALTTAVSGCLDPLVAGDEEAELGSATSALVDARFVVHGLGNRCLDAGAAASAAPGTPLYVYQCNATEAQKVRVVEKTDSHHVELRVHDFCVGARAAVTGGNALELQTCSGANGQRWVLDGDSIRPIDNLELAVAPEGGKSASRTPLVLKSRTLDDSELLYFVAEDGSDRDPTSGFERIETAAELKARLIAARAHSVLVVTQPLTFGEDEYFMDVGQDVTLRGKRVANHEQPVAIYSQLKGDAHLFAAVGARARVTNLNIRGPWPNTDENMDRYGRGLTVYGKIRAYVDRNEFFGWAEAGVAVHGDDDVRTCVVDVGTPKRALVTRNYIHANMMDGAGYGVSTRYGGYAFIQGNTFRANRHAVESDYRPHSGYKATENLILAHVPKQHPFTYTHDFDVHGDGSDGDGLGGRGSAGVEIYRNTFLGLDGAWGHENFDLRGTPCNTSYFRFNVSLQTQGRAIHNEYAGDKLVVSDNRFDMSNPAVRLKAADFDGDGYDDLFIATGAAWYVSYRGKGVWRYLRAATEMNPELKFGDFDGDTRADVMTYHNGAWDVSWGGMSEWERINGAGEPFADYMIGDFDGNGRDDVLYPTGSQWLVSWGGRTAWERYALAIERSRDLRLGDFDGDGKTDVFAVVDGVWKIVRFVDRTWLPLPVSLTSTINGLGVVDANGDGRSDIYSFVRFPTQIRVSYSGSTAFTTLPQFSRFQSGTDAVFGKFDDRPGDDVLGFSSWDDEATRLRLVSGLQGSAIPYSREEMR